jgi:metal-responsive CopG/Arc/MetJ family transcriptional regulator
MKNTRFEMKTPEALLARVDDWRRQQPDLPNRSEAIRRLIEAGLSNGGGVGQGKTDMPAKPLSRARISKKAVRGS